jgi:hypothetical protein
VAILHSNAEITPTRLELLATWLPTQPWFVGDASALRLVGAYRFADPDGEVGMETHLVRAGDGPVLQVPLTYRGAPLAAADQFLAGTIEHTLQGPRWVYHAIGDPVYQAALASTILTGGAQAELVREFGDGHVEVVKPSVRVRGSGSAESELPPADLEILHVFDGTAPEGDEVLTGTWGDAAAPVVLAAARLR